MISLEERQKIAAMIEQARREGARLRTACEVGGIDARTLQRWETNAGLQDGDGRPGAVRPVPAHALSAQEREQILRIANEPRFAALPPARIVPTLADEGVYIASESSFSRVLRAHGQTRHRGRAKAPRRVRPPTTHIATGPRQVWTWDMTFLPTQVLGVWCYMYLILDVYSRKIVGLRCTRATTPSTPWSCCAERRWPKVCTQWRKNLCFMGITARPSRQRPCWR